MTLKVIAEKGARNVPGRTALVACVNATGEIMSPLLVVKGKTE